MTTGDMGLDALVVAFVFCALLVGLPVLYGVLSAFPEEADRLAHWLFD